MTAPGDAPQPNRSAQARPQGAVPMRGTPPGRKPPRAAIRDFSLVVRRRSADQAPRAGARAQARACRAGAGGRGGEGAPSPGGASFFLGCQNRPQVRVLNLRHTLRRPRRVSTPGRTVTPRGTLLRLAARGRRPGRLTSDDCVPDQSLCAATRKATTLWAAGSGDRSLAACVAAYDHCRP